MPLLFLISPNIISICIVWKEMVLEVPLLKWIDISFIMIYFFNLGNINIHLALGPHGQSKP